MKTDELVVKLEGCIDDMNWLIDALNRTARRTGTFKDPVCWNCAKAYKFYLPGCQTQPAYTPCQLWLKTHRCQFEPREDSS